MAELLVDVNIGSYFVERVRKMAMTLYGKKPTAKEMADTLKQIFFTEGEDAFFADLHVAVNSDIISHDNGCRLIETLTSRKEK
jgi:hypothetical protein